MSFGYPAFHVQQSRTLLTARYRYEAARSFDLDDDLEFCPALLSDEEIQSASSSIDGSSLSSGSPNGSPLQQQIQPSSVSSSYSYSSHPSYGNPLNSFPLQGKMQHSQRSLKAIPIVNPNTGMRVSSPPMMSQSAQRSGHHLPRRW